MIVLQPVLEVYSLDGFSLWPVLEVESFGYLPLNGELSAVEVGTAVMRIADYNNVDHDPPGREDPLDAFLHGLLTTEDLVSPGGLRVTDTVTGVMVLPGCCSGLEEWRDWFRAVDGEAVWFGHDPSPGVEHVGDIVRLTVDAEQDGSPAIEMSAAELRRLLARAEEDLTDFLDVASEWATSHLPAQADAIVTAIARALDMPSKP